MAYVGLPFRHDLFVSYSHGDDGNGQAFLRPWSTAFVAELERELRAERKFRQQLSIFLDGDHRLDQGVDPMAPLTEQLREQIGSSAILLVLMSPDYLGSKWCGDERDWWFARQRELGLPSEERVAVVRIWPTGESAWPDVFLDSRGHPLVGFLFHGSADGLPPRPLGWLELEGSFGTEFRKALLGVVGRLYQKLDEVKQRVDEQRAAATETAKLAAPSGQSIYLHGRTEQTAAWEQAALELTGSGFVVVPGSPDPVESDARRLQAIRDRRVETMSECDALLLLGTQDGRALDADLVVVGKHDRHSARARTHRLLPCGLLDTVGPSLATPVRRATARLLQTEWLDATTAPWVPTVHGWLRNQSARSGSAS